MIAFSASSHKLSARSDYLLAWGSPNLVDRELSKNLLLPIEELFIGHWTEIV
jgi:hypothetical protein